MKKLIQTQHSSNGDCFRTAIACVMDFKTPERVPNFFESENTAESAELKFKHFVEAHRKTFISFPVPYPHVKRCVDMLTLENPKHYWIIGGVNKAGNHHVCIYKDGQFIWDPSGKNEPLVGPNKYGHYYAFLIV